MNELQESRLSYLELLSQGMVIQSADGCDCETLYEA